MGNSLRHTLGHMCGGEQAKEIQENGSDQPVSPPKESKKKKKNKKSKKVRNGNLDAIKEEGGTHDESLEISEPPVEREENASPSTPQTQKLENEIHGEICKEEEDGNKRSPTTPVITVDCDGDITVGGELAAEEQVSSDHNSSITLDVQKEADSCSIISTSDDEGARRSIIHTNIKPLKCETFAIEHLDKILEKACTSYDTFVESANSFKDAILRFQEAVEPDQNTEDFLTLWNQYKDKLGEDYVNKNSVNFERCSDIEAMRVTGSALIEEIESVKPVLNKCADDAKSINIIEQTKDEMLEGEQLMATDTFSMPGKYRRNVSELVKCTRRMNEIEVETTEILYCIESYQMDVLKESGVPARESLIIPEERLNDPNIDELLTSLSQESIVIELSECDENSLCGDHEDVLRPETPLPPRESLPLMDLLVSPERHVNHSSDDTCSDQGDVVIKVYYESDDSTQSCKKVSNYSADVSEDIHNCRAVSNEVDNSNDAHVNISSNTQVQFSIPSEPQTHVEIAETASNSLNPLPQVRKDSLEVSSAFHYAESTNDVQPPHNETMNDMECDDIIPIEEIESFLEYTIEELEYMNEDAIVEDATLEDNVMEHDQNIDPNNMTTSECNSNVVEEAIPKTIVPETSTVITTLHESPEDCNTSKFEEILNPYIEEISSNKYEYRLHTDPLVEDVPNVNLPKTPETCVASVPQHLPSEQVFTPPLESTEMEEDSEEIDESIACRNIPHPHIHSSPKASKHISFSQTGVTIYGDNGYNIPHSDIGYDTIPHTDAAEIIDKSIIDDIGEEGCHLKTEEHSCTENIYENNEILDPVLNTNTPPKESGSTSEMLLYDNSSDIVSISDNCIKDVDTIPVDEIPNESCGYALITTHENIGCCNKEIEIEQSESIHADHCDEALLQSDSTVSDAVLSSIPEEVDVVLNVLQKAIVNENVEDTFVELLCSSISRVLGDSEGDKSPVKLQSVESFDSSYEDSMHNSFLHSREVQDWVGTHFQSGESNNYENNKCRSSGEKTLIVPVEKDGMHSPHIISHTIISNSEQHALHKGNHEREDTSPNVRTVSVSLEDLTDPALDEHLPDEEHIKTFVIESLHESTEEENDILTSLCRKERPDTPPQQLCTEPDHNTLEYGNYVFIDPSTGDIQVMRNRSRSLDSLVSMASSRSSISRFGSFEFVTDFEINIAEKNQELLKGH